MLSAFSQPTATSAALPIPAPIQTQTRGHETQRHSTHRVKVGQVQDVAECEGIGRLRDGDRETERRRDRETERDKETEKD